MSGPQGAGDGVSERSTSRSRSASRGRSRTRQSTVEAASSTEINKRVDLGPEAFKHDYDDPVDHVLRPGFTTDGGRVVPLRLNAFRVESIPTKSVWQYDASSLIGMEKTLIYVFQVLIGKGDAEKRATTIAVWNSQTLQKKLGGGWIFDGNKIAWSLNNAGQQTHYVDLDEEKGRPSGGNNAFRVQLRPTKKVGLAVLDAYRNQQASFSSEVLEAINFLDHLLREFPSKKLLAIKRSFFDKNLAGKRDLGNGIVAVKGIYQSLRCAQGNQLIINADVANTCFWADNTLSFLITELSAPTKEEEICGFLQQKTSRNLVLKHQLDRLKRMRITVEYNNLPERSKGRVFTIDAVLSTNARETKFAIMNERRQIVKEVSVMEYFMKEKQHRLTRVALPIIRTTKGQLFPPEVCKVVKGQRYNYRLNEYQTSQMIKFAVTRPPVRSQAIENGLKALDWAGDVYHRNYGLKINPSMIETKARVIVSPSVEFRGGKTEKPGVGGRWRIDGKQFLRPNPEPLSRWAVCVFNQFTRDPKMQITQDEARVFIQKFIVEFKKYGGSLEGSMPPIFNHSDIKTGTEVAWERAKKGDRPPQILFFIINGKITHFYNRIKKNCECRFGVVSQCLQAAHVKVQDSQYIGNVMMKVFAKLGGFAFRANPNQNVKPSPKPEAVVLMPPKTMMIGADVSHAGPGSFQPSMAAMTVSMDHSAMRFAAGVQTNGYRKELIATWTLLDIFLPLLREWMSTVGRGQFPEHIFYFRDGVSEGQYQHVLQQEIRDMKQIFNSMDQSPGKTASKKILWNVIIVSKRHHIRFFPQANNGDKNGNPWPGTLVERDVTHPREFDFYLCSHTAIQGTARPTHYHVLLNDSKGGADILVKMIYSLCYQYARSSTPVSIIPAVYYAHLASKRAMAHERREVDENFKYTGKDLSDLVELTKAKDVCDRTGKIMTKAAVDRLRQLDNLQTPMLLGLPEKGPDTNKIKFSMWYI